MYDFQAEKTLFQFAKIVRLIRFDERKKNCNKSKRKRISLNLLVNRKEDF